MPAAPFQTAAERPAKPAIERDLAAKDLFMQTAGDQKQEEKREAERKKRIAALMLKGYNLNGAIVEEHRQSLQELFDKQSEHTGIRYLTKRSSSPQLGKLRLGSYKQR